jgi:hypothetical protein
VIFNDGYASETTAHDTTERMLEGFVENDSFILDYTGKHNPPATTIHWQSAPAQMQVQQ